MKVIAFILSAYLLLLLAVPCCSFDNCPQDKTEQEAEHNTGDGDCGSCSPFFSCTGCAGATLSFANTNDEIISSMPVQQYSGYILSVIPTVHYDFWQPPKLG